MYIYSIMQTLQNEPTQRLNVDLPQSQYFALKSYALHTDRTVSQLVRESLQDILDYDTWFRARVEKALKAADDISTPRIGEGEWQVIRAKKIQERDALLVKKKLDRQVA